MPSPPVESEPAHLYECALLLPPDPQTQDGQSLWSHVDQLVLECEGRIAERDEWGKCGLAYRVGGYSEGKYVVLRLEIPSHKVREFTEGLKLERAVLRHLLLRLPLGTPFVRYSEKFRQWQESRARGLEEAPREPVRRRPAVKRERYPTSRVPAERKAPLQQQELTQKLDQLLSGEDLKL